MPYIINVGTRVSAIPIVQQQKPHLLSTEDEWVEFSKLCMKNNISWPNRILTHIFVFHGNEFTYWRSNPQLVYFELVNDEFAGFLVEANQIRYLDKKSVDYAFWLLDEALKHPIFVVGRAGTWDSTDVVIRNQEDAKDKLKQNKLKI